MLGAVSIGDATGVQQALGSVAGPIKIYDDGLDTPLSRASADGFIDVVKVLLNAGADANLANREGNTALHFAAWYERSETVGILLEIAAKHSNENILGSTPLSRASRYRQAEAPKKPD